MSDKNIIYQRIGLLSGTFDPPHKGHIALVEYAKEHLNLDEVWLLPERTPRHKVHVTAYAHRLVMCQLVTAAYPWLKVWEAHQAAHDLATINELRQQIPHAHISLIIGADVAVHFNTWEDADKIRQVAEVVSFGRGSQKGDFQFDHPASSRSIRAGLDTNHLSEIVVAYMYRHRLYQE